MDAHGRKTIVLTGASGVVGKALLPELGDHEVICLVNRGTVDGDHTIVRTDVTQPRLGLAPKAYDELARRADCIVHSAAVTEWGEPNDVIRTTNVEGTRNVLELVSAAGAPLYLMSTAFVSAIAPDAPLTLPPTHIIVNYVTSKLDAERLVRGSGLPATIFRPTNLIGDSRTGTIARNQIIQRVTGFVCRGRAPLYPTRRETLVDILPQDVLAKAVAAVIRDEDVGGDYWLTYGDRAFTIARALELCVEAMDGLGRPIRPPTTIEPDEIDAHRDEVEALPATARSLFGHLLEFSDGMTACGVFPSDLDLLTARYELPEPSLERAFVRGLEFWARSKGLQPSATAR